MTIEETYDALNDLAQRARHLALNGTCEEPACRSFSLTFALGRMQAMCEVVEWSAESSLRTQEATDYERFRDSSPENAKLLAEEEEKLAREEEEAAVDVRRALERQQGRDAGIR